MKKFAPVLSLPTLTAIYRSPFSHGRTIMKAAPILLVMTLLIAVAPTFGRSSVAAQVGGSADEELARTLVLETARARRWDYGTKAEDLDINSACSAGNALYSVEAGGLFNRASVIVFPTAADAEAYATRLLAGGVTCGEGENLKTAWWSTNSVPFTFHGIRAVQSNDLDDGAAKAYRRDFQGWPMKNFFMGCWEGGEQNRAGCSGVMYKLAVQHGLGQEQLPEPSPTPGNWDLAIDKIVVLQTVEGGKLVAGKPGAARVFLVWPDESTNVYVTVDFRMDGKKIVSQPANPMIIGSGKKYTRADLKALKNTANFYIDASYFTPGEHTFSATARLGPLPQNQQYIQDPNPNNNSQELKEQVRETRGLTLAFASVEKDKVRPQDVLNYIAKARPFLLDVYPVKNVDILCCGVVYNNVVGTSWTPAIYLVDELEANLRHKSTGFWSQEQRADYAVGIFPSGFFDSTWGPGTFGLSFSENRKSVLVATDGPESLAHEIGHDALGGTEEYNVNPPNGFYLQGATLYHGQERRLEDADLASNFTNGHYINLMGHVDTTPGWINRETWNRLVDYFAVSSAGASKAGLSALRLPLETDTGGFMVGGTLARDGTVRITTKFPVDHLTPPASDSDLESDYRLAGLDSAGNVIASVPLHVNLDEGNPYPFLAALPAPAETASLAILQNERTLLTLSRSPSPPKVSLDEPDPEALESGTANITWQASDPDGDSLTYTLFFSRDDGKSWQPIATDLTEPHVRIDTSDLPGCSRCQLQVLASDGWNIAAAAPRNTFALQDRPPLISVSLPDDGATLDAGEPITFLALGYDPEDGLLTGETVSWSSDRDGVLGNGDRLEVSQLSNGTHKITAVTRDSTGAEAQTTLTITVTGSESSPGPAPDTITIRNLLIGVAGLGLCGFVGFVFLGLLVVFSRRRFAPAVPQASHGSPAPPESIAPQKRIAIPAQNPSRPQNGLLIGGAFALGLVCCSAAAVALYILNQDNPPPNVVIPPVNSPPAITQQPTLTSQPEGTTPQAGPGFDSQAAPFVDDFSNPGSGWDRVQGDDAITDYKNGSYRIWVNKASLLVWATPHKNFDGDVYIEVDATKVGGPDKNEFGLICRYQDANNYYRFVISSDGYAVIAKVKDGDPSGLSSEKMIPIDGINPGAATNHLRVECVGESLRLFVNGRKVASATDSAFTSGDVGLITGSYDIPGVDILFDNFSAAQR
jgi:hypothetical protein